MACAPGVGAGAVFFVTAFLTGALFAAFAGAVWTAAFFAVVFFRTGAAFLTAIFAFAAFAALAFFRLATSLAFAAAESFRFGFVGSAAAWVGSDSPRILAHLAFCARAIVLRAEAETLRLPVGGCGVAASVGPPVNRLRSSAICVSIRSLCCSKPTMAAWMISFVSCFGMCDVLSLFLRFSLSCPAYTAGPILHRPRQ